MYWLLILTIYTSEGVAAHTEKLGDKMSCVRAGLAFVKQSEGASKYFATAFANYSCTEVR